MKNKVTTLKEIATAYGISTKTLSKRIKEVFPDKKETIIRVLYPAEIEKIEAIYGKIATA